jgi:lipopolysaccharide transport system ATP-binding protein
MSDIILSVENVSKLYRLGTVGTGTFGGDFQRFWKTKILGKEDPFLKIGQTNDRTSKEKADFVWALKDINFEVKRGEVLGIIGKNGAGKSTLLKLLSRITSPTTGSIRCAGRMASLLEVGTGFHPELTGRENIFLNGAILGMTKKEIQSKFDEIVDFSGCELFIDTPTKRYSSGMTVRLGFAVAAFLDPEVLIVDEVLAVGDAEFQKKAIGKMQDISKGQGRTVLFVSHSMESVKLLCSRAILIDNGKVQNEGETNKIVNNYLMQINSQILNYDDGKYELNFGDDLNNKNFIKRLELTCDGISSSIIQTGSRLDIILEINSENGINKAELGFRIMSEDGLILFTINNKHLNNELQISKGKNRILMSIDNFPIAKRGKYFITFYMGGENIKYLILENAIFFYVEPNSLIYGGTRKLIDNENFIILNNVKIVNA